jgi:hypothetical protein
MSCTRSSIIRLTLGLASAGVLLSGGCSFSSIASYFAHYNYGGSVLDMTPTTYAFLTSGYQGPGVNPDIDPACTYPPYCNYTGSLADPFSPATP